MKTASLRIRSARLLRYCLLLVGLSALGTTAAQAQAVTCPPNIDFENGDYSNWEYYTGTCVRGTPADGPTFTNITLTGPISTLPTPRHVLMDKTMPVDPYGKFPVVPPGGGNYAMRVGQPGATGTTCERIRYYVHVPVGFDEYSFNYRFAAVLHGFGHDPEDQPTFRVRAYDSATGDTIPCATQNYVASQQLIDVYGFKESDTPGEVIIYLPWSSGALPIINQGGKTIIIDVTAIDCTASGHFGYGYFDVASCGEYKAAVSYCNLDEGIIRFIGTGLTQDYEWYTSSWQYIGKGPYIEVPIPATPDFFYGLLPAGSTGCLDTIKTDTVSNFILNMNPSKTCVFFGNSIQLEANVTGGVGGFNYTWDPNPELSDPAIYNPTATPNDTTKYFVTVADKVGCFRRDSVIVDEAPNAGQDIPVCPLGERPAQLHVYGPADVQYNWYDLNGNTAQYLDCTDCIDPVSNPDVPQYTYTVGYAGCSVLDTIVVYHDTSNSIEAPQDPLLVCRPSFVQLQSIPKGPNPRVNLPCGIVNSITCDPNDQDTATIGYGLAAAKAAYNTPFQTEQKFTKYQFIIPKEDIFRAGFYSGTINALTFRTVAAALQNTNPIDQVILSLGCTDQETYSLSPTNTSFVGGLTTVATVSGMNLIANDWNQIDFSQGYNWDTSKNLIVDLCISQLTPNTGAGTEPVAMVPGAAIQKFDANINVCGGNASAANIRRYFQRPVIQLLHCPTPDLPFEFTWQPGEFLNDSTVQNPTLYVQRSMNLAVYSVGRNGCRLRDSLHIIQPNHDITLQPQDTFICKGQPAYMRASGGNDGYQWFEFSNGVFSDASGSLSCTDCPNPTATPMQTTTYAVIYSNDIGVANPNNDNYNTGCPDTLFTTVNVWDLPNVRINGNDTTVKFGQSVPLYAQGASHYVWTPSGSLTDPNSPAPVASPAQTTNYIVSGTDSNGCVSRDTLTVTIDFHNNLLVPTGFTPNNDGLNDVFKVVNVSFHRLMEFRVFNRWGQEVFSTTDINRGWDGTWKGVPQEMGAYQYIIRVAIPDGNTEMYKGDVTLIR